MKFLLDGLGSFVVDTEHSVFDCPVHTYRVRFESCRGWSVSFLEACNEETATNLAYARYGSAVRFVCLEH